MADTEIHVYREIAGRSLELELVRPVGGDGAVACVVFFHGGAWRQGERGQFLPQCRALAAQGAAAATVSYRLVTDEDGGSPADCSDDAAHAIAFVRAHATAWGVDPRKIVAGGGSAGGQMAAAVAAMGVELAGLVLFNPALAPDGSPRLQFLGDAGPDWRIHPHFPPTLIQHGTADSIVPIDHARRYSDRMGQLGARCELVEYEGMQHAFFNHPAPEGRYEETLAEMMRFLTSLGLLRASGDAAR